MTVAAGPLSGVLVVDKDAGMTSFDVVTLARSRLGLRRIGHAGTLDPAALGVLPLLLGEATKLMEHLSAQDKEYVATVRLGVATDTQDLDGTVVATAPVPLLARSDVVAATRAFLGTIRQIPPMYSAVHHGGTRLYALARRGLEVERAPRTVSVHAIDVEAVELPSVRLRIVCGKGTYIRTLAGDLGAALGCGAAVERLVRERVGPFRLSTAVSVAWLRSAARDELRARVLPPGTALDGWGSVTLSGAGVADFCHGRETGVPGQERVLAAGRVAVCGPAGELLGVGELLPGGSRLRPLRVLHADLPGPDGAPA